METEKQNWLEKGKNTKTQKSKRKIFLGVSLFVLLGLFASVYLYLDKKDSENETPPSLQLEGGQGLIFSGKFLEFTDEDISASQDKVFGTTIPGNVQVLYSENDLSLNTILASIKPDKRLKLMFAIYNPDSKNFDVFPKGAYAGTNLINSKDLDDYVVEKHRGFFIIASKEFEVSSNLKLYRSMPSYLNNSEGANQYLNDFLNTFASANTYDWILLATNPAKIMDTCPERIHSLWVSKPDEKEGVKFVEYNPKTQFNSNNGYAVWALIKGESGSCGGASVAPADTVDTTKPRVTNAIALPENSEVLITFDPAYSNSGFTVEKYLIEYAPTNTNKKRSIETTETTVIIEDLKNGEQYSFSIYAISDEGEKGPGVLVFATPSSININETPIVKNLTAEALNTQVNLKWEKEDEVTGFKPGGYLVEYYAKPNVVRPVRPVAKTLTSKTNSASIPGLTNGTQYIFIVYPVSASGEKGRASEVTAVPKARISLIDGTTPGRDTTGGSSSGGDTSGGSGSDTSNSGSTGGADTSVCDDQTISTLTETTLNANLGTITIPVSNDTAISDLRLKYGLKADTKYTILKVDIENMSFIGSELELFYAGNNYTIEGRRASEEEVNEKTQLYVIFEESGISTNAPSKLTFPANSLKIEDCVVDKEVEVEVSVKSETAVDGSNTMDNLNTQINNSQENLNCNQDPISITKDNVSYTLDNENNLRFNIIIPENIIFNNNNEKSLLGTSSNSPKDELSSNTYVTKANELYITFNSVKPDTYGSLVLPSRLFKHKSCDKYSEEIVINGEFVVGGCRNNTFKDSNAQTICYNNMWYECNVDRAYERVSDTDLKTNDYICSVVFSDYIREGSNDFSKIKWSWVKEGTVYKPYTDYLHKFVSNYYILTNDEEASVLDGWTSGKQIRAITETLNNLSVDFLFYCGKGFEGLLSPGKEYGCGFNGKDYNIVSNKYPNTQKGKAQNGFLSTNSKYGSDFKKLSDGLDETLYNANENDKLIPCRASNLGEHISYLLADVQGDYWIDYICIKDDEKHIWTHQDGGPEYGQFGVFPSKDKTAKQVSVKYLSSNNTGKLVEGRSVDLNRTLLCDESRDGEQFRAGDYTYLCKNKVFLSQRTFVTVGNLESTNVYIFPSVSKLPADNESNDAQQNVWNKCDDNNNNKTAIVNFVTYSCNGKTWDKDK